MALSETEREPDSRRLASKRMMPQLCRRRSNAAACTQEEKVSQQGGGARRVGVLVTHLSSGPFRPFATSRPCHRSRCLLLIGLRDH